ncbi:heterokaryon incompatibility protein-domain-containing protein [Rhexocercosporidium sp. MPI-PUGE-AT-0058]|nr:heterokaryon incompatibility protein-domain-containing protein [Rhexocercosporidium sp. MPI-PUGE-AT-0058]
MNSEGFVYSPLPDDSIRLVQFEIGPSEHISLKLGVCTLKSAPHFTALSYTWGGEARSKLINLQGTVFRITPNLEAFLLEAKRRIETLSTKNELDEKRWNGGWLWIDAICIDQSNTLEKNVQVAMMKNIYERAQTIISWLGKLDDDAKLGMEYVLDFDYFRERKPLNQSSKFSSDIMPGEEWKLLREKAIHATHKLISRSYWTRVWIIQEATTPKEPCHSLVWCGSYTDDFETFTKSADWITRISMIDGLPGKLHNVSTDALRGLISIRKMRQNHIASDIIDLYFLLPYVHTFDATDSRDKIFGLSSLFPEKGLTSTVPDYNANARDVYFRVACNLIRSDRRLDILGFCATVGDFCLPSWVPDWTSTYMPKPFLRRSLDASLRLTTLYNATNNTEFNGSIDEDNGILYASGFEFDGVSWLAIPRFDNSGRDQDIALSWQIAALAPWSKYITGCTRQEALAHTVCADAACFSDDPQVHSLLGKRLASVPVPDHDHDLGIFAWPDPLVRDSTVQRVLFFTDKGYMGLGPYTTNIGDKVCLLKGAQFPVILRGEKDDWALVGESYVHGIMDGEGWQEMLSEKNTECEIRTFAVK